MANKRVATIVIKADGTEVRETTKEVERLSDGLQDLDVRQAREAAEALKSLGFTDLSQATQQINSIKQATAGLDDKSVRQFSRVLQAEMDAAANAGQDYVDVLRRFKPELDQLANNLKSGAISQEDYNRRVSELPPIMQRALADSRQFGNEIKGIGEKVEKSAQSFEKLKNAGETIQNFGNSVQGIGNTLTVGLTLPIIGLGAAIVSVGTGYESALNSFQAVTNATADEMARAAEVAKQLGADVTLPATSAKDAALAMEELGKAGMSAAESMSAAKGVLQLAAAGQLEEAKAAEITANALNSFSLAASESVRVADLLAAAANASSAGVGDIAEALAQSSASFAAAKVTIEDLTAAIAIMANAGIKGSDAGTSLKTFLSSIQAPSKAGADALEELGIKIFDAQGKMKGFPEIIGLFEKSLSGLNDEK